MKNLVKNFNAEILTVGLGFVGLLTLLAFLLIDWFKYNPVV